MRVNVHILSYRSESPTSTSLISSPNTLLSPIPPNNIGLFASSWTPRGLCTCCFFRVDPLLQITTQSAPSYNLSLSSNVSYSVWRLLWPPYIKCFVKAPVLFTDICLIHNTAWQYQRHSLHAFEGWANLAKLVIWSKLGHLSFLSWVFESWGMGGRKHQLECIHPSSGALTVLAWIPGLSWIHFFLRLTLHLYLQFCEPLYLFPINSLSFSN